MSGSAEIHFYQLGTLLASQPDLSTTSRYGQISPEALTWLAKVCAIANASGHLAESVKLQVAADALAAGLSIDHNRSIFSFVAQRLLAILELKVPSAAKGAFISSGEEFAAYSAVAKIIGGAQHDVMVVDPYLDASVLTDFLSGAPDSVTIRLLSDKASYKPDLLPAFNRWQTQYGQARPIQARLTAKRGLHDRLLLVDGGEAWILTQSLKDFAKRSHATIQRADPDMGSLKCAAYEEIWAAAEPLT